MIDSMEGSKQVQVDIQVSPNTLVTRLEEKLERLSPLSTECSIYRVPPDLRQSNAEAFTPTVISIGPLHHNSEKLKHMEEHKLRFLKDFMSRTKVTLDDYIDVFKNKEVRLRNCYAEAIEFDSDKFIEIILVDATFIVEAFLRYNSAKLRHDNDHFLSRPWKIHGVRTDMLLLENQLPFFIIEEVLSLAKSMIPIETDVRRSAIQLTHNFFKKRVHLEDVGNFDVEKLYKSKIEHFVDFVRTCYLPPKLPSQAELHSVAIPSATQLRQAGIRFEVGRGENMFNIRFRKDDGILEIPRFRIYRSTEHLLRNLIAYERCHFDYSYVNDYVYIIDRLIDTPDDVELLVRSEILESKLAGGQEVASFINKLDPGQILIRANFHFTDLCNELNDYCRVPWHKWKATLKHDYFNNPWAIISFIAAVVLLILTFIQTIYSVIAYHI